MTTTTQFLISILTRAECFPIRVCVVRTQFVRVYVVRTQFVRVYVVRTQFVRVQTVFWRHKLWQTVFWRHKLWQTVFWRHKLWQTVFWRNMPICSRILFSNYWWQKSDICSQVSYRYPISWETFFDPSDSYFLFVEERGYHKWALAHRLVTKYQISAINSCWEKCDEKCAYKFNVYKKQLSRQTGSRNLTGPKTLRTIWHTYMKLGVWLNSFIRLMWKVLLWQRCGLIALLG
jgi:hypothetical protein